MNAEEKIVKKGMQVKCDRHFLRYAVPSPVWRQSEFRWYPTEIDGLTLESQIHSVGLWNLNPINAQTFVVTASDILRAEYFAAMLVEAHVRQNRHANVQWLPIYHDELDRSTGEFRHAVPLRKQQELDPTLLVLSNLGLESSDVQVEKARDVMARWPSCPVILIGAGKHIGPKAFAKYMLVAMHRAVHVNYKRGQIDV